MHCFVHNLMPLILPYLVNCCETSKCWFSINMLYEYNPSSNDSYHSHNQIIEFYNSLIPNDMPSFSFHALISFYINKWYTWIQDSIYVSSLMIESSTLGITQSSKNIIWLRTSLQNFIYGSTHLLTNCLITYQMLRKNMVGWKWLIYGFDYSNHFIYTNLFHTYCMYLHHRPIKVLFWKQYPLFSKMKKCI